jgi:hypothetical protein
VIQQAYANIAIPSLPNSPDFIFPYAAPNYIYNPLLTEEEHNVSLPYSPVPYALLKLAKEALHHHQIEEEDGLPLPFLQYPLLEAFIPDEEIPIKELPPPQVVAPVTVVPSPAPKSPVLHRGPTSTIFPIIEPTILHPHQQFDGSPVIPTYNKADLYPNLFSIPLCTMDTRCHPHQYTISF